MNVEWLSINVHALSQLAPLTEIYRQNRQQECKRSFGEIYVVTVPTIQKPIRLPTLCKVISTFSTKDEIATEELS